MKNAFKLLLFLLFSINLSLKAQEIQSSFTLDGELFDSSGQNLLLDPNVLLRVQVLNPAKTCVLYDESRFVNTQSSNGFFSIQVGSLVGNSRRTSGSDPSNDFKKIFQNGASIPATGSSCSGNVYNSLANDVRFLRIIVTPTGGSANVLQPDMILGSSPVSAQARELNGRGENDFIQVSGAVSQSNALSVLTNTSSILGLVAEKPAIDNLISASLNFVTQSSLTTQLNSKQNSLGFTPLNPANNLSDVSSTASSRSNLGLGSASIKNVPSSGNANASEVVLGNDTRLTDSRPPAAHTHVLTDITNAGALAGLNTVPNNKTTATSLNTPDTIVLRDSGGFFQSEGVNANSSLTLGSVASPEIVMTTTDLPDPSGYLNLGTSIIHSYNKGSLGIYTENNADSDSIQTDNLVIGTGNKLSGTGDSGSILLSTGSSAGGSKGYVYVNANLYPTEDNVFQLGASPNNSDGNRWASVYSSFISATDSIGLRDLDGNPIMTSGVVGPLNGVFYGPFVQSPTNFGLYNSYGFRGRDNNSGDNNNTHHLYLSTGSKNNGNGNTGNIIARTGFLVGSVVGTRGEFVVDARQLNLSSTKIVNLASPTAATDAANKNYVDSAVSGATSSLSAVATSGNYNDLSNKPSLGSLASLSIVSDTNITNLNYSKLTGVPLSFSPSAHTHSISDVTNLQTTLNSKLDVSYFNNAVSNANCTSSQTAYWNSVLSQISCQNIIFSADPVNKTDPANKNYADTFGGSRFFTAAGTTTTLAVSDMRDTIITGTLSHTFVLPTTANLQIGNWWRFVNRSTQAITVQTASLSLLATVPSQTVYHVRVLSTSSESFAAYGSPIYSSADGSINFNSGKGINLATPTNSTDAANKDYVDNLVASVSNLGSINQDLIFVDSLSNSNSGTRMISTGSPTAPVDLNASDNLLIQSGPSSFGSTGNVTIKTSQATNQNWGNGTVRSGSLILSVGGGGFPIAPGTLKIQDSSNGNGTTGIVGNVWTQTAADGSGSWQAPTIANVVKSTGMTAPKVCSFFVSNGIGVETACVSAGCTTQNINGDCATVGSVTRSSTGKYSYNFPVSYWNNPTKVNCTASYSVCGGGSGVCVTRVSNSLTSTGRAIEFYDNTNTPQDASFSIVCHGD